MGPVWDLHAYCRICAAASTHEGTMKFPYIQDEIVCDPDSDVWTWVRWYGWVGSQSEPEPFRPTFADYVYGPLEETHMGIHFTDMYPGSK